MLRTRRGTAEETGLRRPVARCAHTPRVCVPGEGSRRPSCRRCFPSCFPAAVSPSAASSGPHLPVWLGAHSRTAAACRAALRGPPRPLSRPPASSQCRGVWTAPVISCLWFLVPRWRPSHRFQWASGLFLRTRRCKPYVPHWGLLASHRFGWDHSKSGRQEAGHISAFDGTSYLCKTGPGKRQTLGPALTRNPGGHVEVKMLSPPGRRGDADSGPRV